jgi:hypothetical protein
MRSRVWLGGLLGAGLVAGALFVGCSGDDQVSSQGGTAGNGGSAAAGGQGGAPDGGGGQAPGGGGSGGVGGAGGSGGTGPSAEPECESAAECQLVDDCCDCMGFPAAVDPPQCPQQCIINSCEAAMLPLPTATCAVGRCVVDASCDPADTICDAVPPNCPLGQAPVVVNGCWGGCIATIECGKVGNCGQCTGPNDVCVVEETQLGPIHHCVDKPVRCEGAPDCACMGASVCLEPFDTCSDAQTGQITCQCIDC